jgi:hypothetical protein
MGWNPPWSENSVLSKHQIPSTKSQINPNDQIRNFKPSQFELLESGIWRLFGIWDLTFGISSDPFLDHAVLITAFKKSGR